MRKFLIKIVSFFMFLFMTNSVYAAYTLNVGSSGASIDVNFGNVATAVEKSYEVVYLKNTGSDNFSISNILEVKESPFYIQDIIHIDSQGNAARVDFNSDTGQVNNPILVQPGEQLEVVVGFPEQYVETGTYSTSFELITTNSTETFATINCSATVVSGSASLSVPASVDFGNLIVGDINQESFFIVNNGTTSLTITGFNTDELAEKGVSITTIYQDSVSGFVDANAPITLLPGDKLTVALQYTPVNSGTVVIPFEIFINSQDLSKKTILLNANVSDRTYSLKVNTTSIDLGDMEIGELKEGAFIITNNGTADITLTGVNSDELANRGVTLKTGVAGVTLAPGEELTVQFSYTAKDLGNVSIPINIYTSVSQFPMVSVTLNANVSDRTYSLKVNTTSIDLGDMEIGELKEGAFIITNNGTADITLTGVNSDELANRGVTLKTGVAGVTLAPGEELTVQFSYTAKDLGNVSIPINIYTSVSQFPMVSVTLNANVAFSPSSITVSTTKIDFGNVTVGEVKEEIIYVENNGTSSILIFLNSNELASKGVNIVAYNLYTGEEIAFPALLSSEDALILKIEFTPVVSGLFNETMKIFTNNQTLSVIPVDLKANVVDVTQTIVSTNSTTSATNTGTTGATTTTMTTTSDNTTNETVTTEDIPESGGSCSISPSGTVGFDLLLPFVTLGFIYFRKKENR
ncbi:choice-of-anchor D domain-containing protein [Desulfurobacterium atlanticum]|uniref:HYDIN/VesB/CFA65-like Ig-like domain-containing protein n=1 Tax=Desulfurobacterium atlanticum TaxID=240169 RepID=A0A238Z5V0_9BACT|nr:choice-of-anchor D domain-containing protein [Desulfurobacterium atlanticum]SNR78562.1 Protein of unknown function [Desulfurobacterium atlanticum]